MNRYPVILLILLFTIPLIAQENPVPATPAEKRLEGFAERKELQENSLLNNVEFRNIGPTIMSGRVTDLAVSPEDPTHFFVAYASGGLWETNNNGNSFTPLFDEEASMTIGDIAVDWDSDIIYVGTGENNSSRSSYAGTGIYKSSDHGKTWENLGLEETQHTGRIILHPENKNVFWVAALGHLYSPNKERGVYKTTDGGNTWRKTLYVDDNTGAIDLVINPDNPDILLAAMWHRTRRAWNFTEAGSSSGIFRSTDGGETWNKVNTEGSGFPYSEGIGRIGLTVYPENPDIVYAVLDNQQRRPEEQEEEPVVSSELLKDITDEDFLKLDNEALNGFLRNNGFEEKYNAETVKDMVRNKNIRPVALAEYLEDANSMLFDTPVTGAEVYRSEDGGLTWQKTHEGYIEDVYFSYGYYFGEIRVSPLDDKKIYVLGVPLIKSDDGGKTFVSISRENVHADHQAMWVSPNRPGHIIDGNDGGVNITYDDGETWFKMNAPAVGQFYTVNIDMAEPYNVYGGLQDNGVWVGPSTNADNRAWRQEGKYPFTGLMGGDGMQVEIDTRTNDIVYTGFQFGNYFRIDRSADETEYIAPKHHLGERPYRFNWQTPIHLSRHNRDILYMGSNKFHRSMAKGDNFATLSDDLTTGGKKGDVPYGTLTTIDESPLKFGLIYTGSDDGLVHISRDGGYTWENITAGLPENMWVSRVDASNHRESRVYVSLNGYRWDNFEAMVYVSDNYGKTWKKIGKDLPAEPVNVIKEDPNNINLLYVGTDHELYASLDGGESFMAFSAGMPAAPVHDLVIHPRDNEVVVGTHGRSIYIADVSHIQQLTPDIREKELYVFDFDGAASSDRWGERSWQWEEPYTPEVKIGYWAKSDGNAEIAIKTENGVTVKTITDEAEKGLNFITYDFTVAEKFVDKYKGTLEKPDGFKAKSDKKYYLAPGKYIAEINLNGSKEIRDFEITAGGNSP